MALHLARGGGALPRTGQSRGHLVLGRLSWAMLGTVDARNLGRRSREEMMARVSALGRLLLRRIALGLIGRRVLRQRGRERGRTLVRRVGE